MSHNESVSLVESDGTDAEWAQFNAHNQGRVGKTMKNVHGVEVPHSKLLGLGDAGSRQHKYAIKDEKGNVSVHGHNGLREVNHYFTADQFKHLKDL